MLNRILYFLIIFSFSLKIFGEVPYEKFYTNRDSLPNKVLSETIGILSLSSGVKRNNTIIIYNDEFEPQKSLNLRYNSRPISNFGYHGEEDTLISNYRYPIIEVNSDFIKVAIDFKKQVYGWLSIKEINDRYYHRIVDFEKADLKCSEFITLFDLYEKEERKVFKNPSDTSNFYLISKEETISKNYQFVDKQNDFLKIVQVGLSPWMELEIKKELGWIKMRDESTRLNIWIIAKDLY